MLKLVERDSYLEPYSLSIEGRYQYFVNRVKQFTKNGRQTLSDFASGYLYFGLHRTSTGWVFREWAPNAKKIVLIGDFSNWEELPEYELKPLAGGVWERNMPKKALAHGQHYKMKVYWDGGCGERIPAWVRRVVQDDATKIFSAQVWAPEQEYEFKNKKFQPKNTPLLIYECHIGMAQEEEKVGTYREFREKVLPRVAADGYNCIQIMAIQEHPYYGSFGYHVSNFFAASSRFGTPEELKELIDAPVYFIGPGSSGIVVDKVGRVYIVQRCFLGQCRIFVHGVFHSIQHAYHSVGTFTAYQVPRISA